jgi:Gas vesicle synthesis protein GvpL/GvpF
MDETLVHAYGVVAAQEPYGSFPSGIADTRVWLYPVEGLAAIVSLLPSDGFGAADWERNAANLSWLETVARRHNEVLQYAATSAAVVPLRLPSLYSDLESLAATLRAAGERLEQSLRRIEGKLEWSVKVYRIAKEATPAVSVETTSGSDYLLARSRDLNARSTAREQLHEQVGELHDAFGHLSAEHVRNQPQDAVLSGRSEQMLLNGAYLVNRADEAQFLKLTEEIADGADAKGLMVEVSGPWPAYNFTDADTTTNQVAT